MSVAGAELGGEAFGVLLQHVQCILDVLEAGERPSLLLYLVRLGIERALHVAGQLDRRPDKQASQAVRPEPGDELADADAGRFVTRTALSFAVLHRC